MVLVPAEVHQQSEADNNKVETKSKLNKSDVSPQYPEIPQWDFVVDKQYSTYPKSALDGDMKAILEDDKLSIDAKYAQYQDAMIRHRIATSKQQFPLQSYQQVPLQSYKRIHTIHESAAMDIEKLLYQIPEQKKRNARMLLHFLANLPQFSVNGLNEIQLHGSTIENTNLSELLREFSVDQKTPTELLPEGYQQFIDFLRQMHVSPQAIGNEQQRNQLNVSTKQSTTNSSRDAQTRILRASSLSPPPPPPSSIVQNSFANTPKSSIGTPIRSEKINKRKKLSKSKGRKKQRSESSDDEDRTVWINGIPVKEKKTWQDW